MIEMERGFWQLVFSAYDIFLIKIDLFCSTLVSRLSLSFQGAKVGKGFRTSGNCKFKCRHKSSIKIGNDVHLIAAHRTNRVGLMNPVLLETMGDGVIKIGNYTGASAVVISSRAQVSIGNYVKIGANVRILDHDFHSLVADIRRTDSDSENVKSLSIVIEDDVFIGTNALILKGTRVGARSIIGAGAVVAGEKIPPDSLVIGNPAVIKSRK